MQSVKITSELFANANLDWESVGFAAESEIEIHLGINQAFSHQLVGDGEVPCWCLGRDGDGRFPGMANSPGFVCLLCFDDLVAAGFTEDEIYLEALGCNKGTKLDKTNGLPVCEDCLSVAGENGGRLPKSQHGHACWCCAEMALEAINTDKQYRAESEAMVAAFDAEYAEQEAAHFAELRSEFCGEEGHAG